MPLEWINREAWNALPARRCVSITPPVKHVFLTIAQTSQCSSDEACAREMRILQDKHIRQGMEDIRYNFTVGGRGQLIEGRGWMTRTVLEPNFKDIEGQSIIIAYLGGYTQETLPQVMYDYSIELFTFGMLHCFIDKNCEYHDLLEKSNSLYKED